MEELIPLFGIFFVIGVPVMSIAARFVLRPLIEDLTEAVRGGKTDEVAELQARLTRLESALAEQGYQLERLTEAEHFRRQLESRQLESRPASHAAAAGRPASTASPD